MTDDCDKVRKPSLAQAGGKFAQFPLDGDIHVIVYLELAYRYVALVSDQAERPKYATVVWEGDSRELLQAFPEDVRQNLGFQLWQLQQGERPSDYRPLPSTGTGVFELRDQDERAWYRVVCLSRINDVIYVLHCFEKKSRGMPRAAQAVKARWAEEKK